jgi:hypothetical protein
VPELEHFDVIGTHGPGSKIERQLGRNLAVARRQWTARLLDVHRRSAMSALRRFETSLKRLKCANSVIRRWRPERCNRPFAASRLAM